MPFNSKLIFPSLLLTSALFTLSNRQMEIDVPEESSGFFTAQVTLFNAQTSAPVGNVGVSLKDSKGNLWFGTGGKGLYRYDAGESGGQQKLFTNFTTEDGLSSNMIMAILEDKKGNLWLGTDGGITRYDGKTFTAIPTPNNFVASLMEDKNGKLWVATSAGVYWYDGKSFMPFLAEKQVNNPNKLALRVVQQMLQDRQDKIWILRWCELVARFRWYELVARTLPQSLLSLVRACSSYLAPIITSETQNVN